MRLCSCLFCNYWETGIRFPTTNTLRRFNEYHFFIIKQNWISYFMQNGFKLNGITFFPSYYKRGSTCQVFLLLFSKLFCTIDKAQQHDNKYVKFNRIVQICFRVIYIFFRKPLPYNSGHYILDSNKMDYTSLIVFICEIQ